MSHVTTDHSLLTLHSLLTNANSKTIHIKQQRIHTIETSTPTTLQE